MLCEACKNQEASVFLTQIVEGSMQKLNLCESCSKEKGVDDPTGFALQDVLLGISEAAMDVAKLLQKNSQPLSCPSCGLTQETLKKNGRLGCNICYTAFREDLEVMLQTMHRGSTHRGKVPRLFAQEHAKKLALETLQSKLEKAIEAEDYEQAAVVRDELSKVKEAPLQESEEGLRKLMPPSSHHETTMQGMLPLEALDVPSEPPLKKGVSAKRKKAEPKNINPPILPKPEDSSCL